MLATFSHDEKASMLPIIDMVLKCADESRRKGVLALEEFAQEQGNDFLAFAIMLVVDGTDPALVKGILETLIAADNHSGCALLERTIIAEGALAIQAGENPRIMETKLLCLLGEDWLRQRGHFPVFNPAVELDRRISGLIGKNERNTFCEMVLKMSDAKIQVVFTQVDQRELALAVNGCDEETAKKLLKNLSPRLAVVVLDDIEYTEKIHANDVTAAQEKITNIVRRLGYEL